MGGASQAGRSRWTRRQVWPRGGGGGWRGLWGLRLSLGGLQLRREVETEVETVAREEMRALARYVCGGGEGCRGGRRRAPGAA